MRRLPERAKACSASAGVPLTKHSACPVRDCALQAKPAVNGFHPIRSVVSAASASANENRKPPLPASSTTRHHPAVRPEQTLLSSPSKARPVVSNPHPRAARPEEPVRDREARQAEEDAAAERAAKQAQEEQELELRRLEEAHRARIQAQRDSEQALRNHRAKIAQQYADRKERALASAMAAARDKSRKGVAQVDAWHKLVEGEKQVRSKYYETPRSLLLMLEEERTKILQLETDHQALLHELETVKRAYEGKIKDQQYARECDIKNLQRALVDKTDECNALTKKLGSATTKHADDVLVWSARTEKLDGQIAKLQAALQTTETRYAKQEKATVEVHTQRKILQERLQQREVELKKAARSAKEKDSDWLQEKEQRMRLEVRVLELEHLMAQRDEQIGGLKSANHRKQTELEDLGTLRAQAEALKQELALVSAKEKTLAEELDKSHAQERKTAQNLDQLSLQHRKAVNEIDRLKTKEAALKDELQQVTSQETKARQEIDLLLDRQSQLMHELGELTQIDRKRSSEVDTLRHDAAQLKAKISEDQNRITDLNHHIVHLETRADQLADDKDKVDQDRQRLLADVAAYKEDAKQLETMLRETEALLEAERRSVVELKATLKEKQATISQKQAQIAQLEGSSVELRGKISDLNGKIEQERLRNQLEREDKASAQERLLSKLEALEETAVNAEMELNASRKAESQLKQRLSEAHDERNELQHKVEDVQAKLSSVTANAQDERDRTWRELSKLRQEEEQARVEYANQAGDLQLALQQKQQQIVGLSNQAETVHRDRDQLRAQVEELEQARHTSAAAIERLQTALIGKERDLAILKMTYDASKTTIRHLKEELETVRRIQERAADLEFTAGDDSRMSVQSRSRLATSNYKPGKSLTSDAPLATSSVKPEQRSVAENIRRQLRSLDAQLESARESGAGPIGPASNLTSFQLLDEATITGYDELSSPDDHDHNHDHDHDPDRDHGRDHIDRHGDAQGSSGDATPTRSLASRFSPTKARAARKAWSPGTASAEDDRKPKEKRAQTAAPRQLQT